MIHSIFIRSLTQNCGETKYVSFENCDETKFKKKWKSLSQANCGKRKYLVYFFKIYFNFKALEYDQKQYSSNNTYLKFKHVVMIPVGSRGEFDSCEGVSDVLINPCG